MPPASFGTHAMKTPRTDKALDAIAGILDCVRPEQLARDPLAEKVEQLRGVPSAVIRCSGTLDVIDELLSRFASRPADAPAPMDDLEDRVAKLRKLRIGLRDELDQANANAALESPGDDGAPLATGAATTRANGGTARSVRTASPPSTEADAQWVAIHSQLFSVSLDARTSREIRRGYLPAGTMVEHAKAALHDAERAGAQVVTVRTRNPQGWIGLDSVGVRALRDALRR